MRHFTIALMILRLSVGYQCGDHKRTQQGVSAKLLPYLYNLHMVHAT